MRDEASCQHRRTRTLESRQCGEIRVRRRLCYDCERIVFTREEEAAEEEAVPLLSEAAKDRAEVARERDLSKAVVALDI